MNKDSGLYVLDSIGVVFTYLQTEHVFQIVSLILTIVATTLSIVFTAYKWFKKAWKDKHISLEELEELEEELKEKMDKGENKE